MRTFPAAFLILASSLCCVVANEGPTGLPARPTAADYNASAHYRNSTFAASLVPAKQVEHLFAFDISKTYVVFEVAAYANGEPLRIARQTFSVKVNASGDSIHNAERSTVASSIQRQNLPSIPSARGGNVADDYGSGATHALILSVPRKAH